MNSLPQLIRMLPTGRRILYTGDDWKEYCFPKGKTLLYRENNLSLYLINSRQGERRHLFPSQIQVLQSELKLSSGERIREGDQIRIPEVVTGISKEECVYLELFL